MAKQFWGRISLESAMAMLYFRKATRVQNLIHNLKYNGKIEIGFYLGSLLGERLKDNPNYKDINFIIPVPLHPKKLKKRGYNQCSHIAKGLSEIIQKPIIEDVLFRKEKRESQTTKNRYNRYENMQMVFNVASFDKLQNQHVLLIDDIITTGATLEACAKVLLEHGAKVSIAALAFAE
ncbi:ComF family protein [Pedobacter sp. AW1-32]|uniref:ComF family protein n=1 Tax=Pedobacter sp. AW1-32 TaxID=3383026 RepID=UPI003FEF1344